jgi:hypothetical protein
LKAGPPAADEIIAAQVGEIALMTSWLAENAK